MSNQGNFLTFMFPVKLDVPPCSNLVPIVQTGSATVQLLSGRGWGGGEDPKRVLEVGH